MQNIWNIVHSSYQTSNKPKFEINMFKCNILMQNVILIEFPHEWTKNKCRVKIFYTLLFLNQMTNMAVYAVIKITIKDTNNTATTQVMKKNLILIFSFDEINLISATRAHFCQQIKVVNKIHKQHFIACNAIKCCVLRSKFE